MSNVISSKNTPYNIIKRVKTDGVIAKNQQYVKASATLSLKTNWNAKYDRKGPSNEDEEVFKIRAKKELHLVRYHKILERNAKLKKLYHQEAQMYLELNPLFSRCKQHPLILLFYTYFFFLKLQMQVPTTATQTWTLNAIR
jgi:hypothetical protein